MSDNQQYISPVRGAVAQHVPGNAGRNPQAYMARQSIYGPISLRRWGPRPFGFMEQVGGTMKGLGDAFSDFSAVDPTGAPSWLSDPIFESAAPSSSPSTWFLPPIPGTAASSGATVAPGGVNWSLFAMLAVGAFLVAEMT